MTRRAARCATACAARTWSSWRTAAWLSSTIHSTDARRTNEPPRRQRTQVAHPACEAVLLRRDCVHHRRRLARPATERPERMSHQGVKETNRMRRAYLERTIATVRNHRDADNCWPQWANIFAD